MPWNKLSCSTDAQLCESSAPWNYTCFPQPTPSAFVYYTNSVVQNRISYCKMRILKSKLHLAFYSKCQSNWAPCLICDYQGWTYWKTLKSIPLNKEQIIIQLFEYFSAVNLRSALQNEGGGWKKTPKTPHPTENNQA